MQWNISEYSRSLQVRSSEIWVPELLLNNT